MAQLEQQKEKWRLEQLEIASKVEKLPDAESEPPVTFIDARFKCVPLMQRDGGNPQKTYYGGVDVSFPVAEEKDNNANSKDGGGAHQSREEQIEGRPSVAVYVVLEYPSGNVVYQDHEYFALQVPYIPSYLAFREIDPLERLIKKQLRERPEFTPKAILVDGNGIFHCRRAGIACFVGTRTGIPTIGVSKTLYYEGELNKDVVFQQLKESLHAASTVLQSTHPPSPDDDDDVVIFDQKSIPRQCAKISSETPDSGEQKKELDRGELINNISLYCRGFAVPLAAKDGVEVLACALVGHGGQIKKRAAASSSSRRTGTKNPIYVSIGHKVSLQESVCICAAFSFAKIPEPVRQADLIGRELQRCRKGQDAPLT